jgi:hypothetical protein
VVDSEEIEEALEEEEAPILVMKIKQEKKEPSQDSKEPENNYDFSFQNLFIFISLAFLFFIVLYINFILFNLLLN